MILAHGDKFQDTLELENAYSELISAPLEYQAVEQYIKDVCNWGNYAGIWGKVLQNNEEQRILNVFEVVRQILSNPDPDLATAIANLNTLYGLGQTSFASKHLRFMRPSECPVYDSILNGVLPYSFDPPGYAQFADDCKLIGQQLSDREIVNPARNAVTWFAADVEAAIFTRYYE